MSGWWLASYVALWVLVAALALLVLALARQVGTLHLRLGPRGALEVDGEGPPLGEALPPIEALDADGRPVSVGGPGEARLVLFVSADCPICREVLPSVPVVARHGRLAPVLVTDDDPSEASGLSRWGAELILAPGIADRLSVPGTPYAMVLDRSGVVRAKGTVNNLEQVEGLVDTAARRIEEPAR